jgi:lipid A 4'-phosphatase
MNEHAHPSMHRIKTLWRQLDCAPDLTQASIGTALGLSALWVILLWFFNHVPQIDRGVASLFFHASDCGSPLAQTVCGSFPLSQNSLAKLLRKVLFYLPYVAIVLILVALIVRLLQAQDKKISEFPVLKKRNDDEIAKLSLTLLSVLIGPVFLVNILLKEWSGRPRPVESSLFGGDLSFVPAGSFAGACHNNCSFISGEAAGAGLLICIVALLPAAWRARLGSALVFASIATPLLRVAFGGHYVSDVVLGWLSSLVVFAWVFAVYHLRNRPQKRSDSGR